ncbi:MAG: HepT-like ribonuclease domain-containing protein, partial [Nanoarchaeota archaeon]
MNKDATIFLKHILESINLIEKYTENITEEQFLKSVEKQDLVTRRLEIIGEAIRNLPEEFRMEHKDI